MCVTGTIILCSFICKGEEIFTSVCIQYDILDTSFYRKEWQYDFKGKNYDFVNI